MPRPPVPSTTLLAAPVLSLEAPYVPRKTRETSAALEAHKAAVEQLAGVTVKAVQGKQLLEEAVKALKEECASVQAQLVSVEGKFTCH